MKLSDMTVTMSMSTYNDINRKLEELSELKASIRACVDTISFDLGISPELNVSLPKVNEIIRKYLSIRYTSCPMGYIES